ncbi:sorting and assembly machinery component 50, partial [Desmophyllum pertusum]
MYVADAEQVRKQIVSFGTKTRMSYQLAFFKPTPGTPERSFTLAAQKSTTDVPLCSHWEATQGLSMDYMFPSIIGQHCLSWEGSWREVTGLARNASFEIREQRAIHLRVHSSTQLLWIKGDNMALP